MCVRGIYAKVFGVSALAISFLAMAKGSKPIEIDRRRERERDRQAGQAEPSKWWPTIKWQNTQFAQLPQLARFAHWFDPAENLSYLWVPHSSPTLLKYFSACTFFCVIINYVIRGNGWTFGQHMISWVFSAQVFFVFGGAKLELRPLSTCLCVSSALMSVVKSLAGNFGGLS